MKEVKIDNLPFDMQDYVKRIEHPVKRQWILEAIHILQDTFGYPESKYQASPERAFIDGYVEHAALTSIAGGDKGIDLVELERKVDEALANETPESLKEWLRNHRLSNTSAGNIQDGEKWEEMKETSKSFKEWCEVWEWQENYRAQRKLSTDELFTIFSEWRSDSKVITQPISINSNSEVGSYHWLGTLLGFIKRTGEHLKTYGASKAEHQTIVSWGNSLYDFSSEILAHYHRSDASLPAPVGDNWVRVEDGLPDEGTEVMCWQPERKDIYGKTIKGRALAGRLFTIGKGERDGNIDLELVHDKNFPLLLGGTFWAFPYICHQNFVTHWQPLPTHPHQ